MNKKIVITGATKGIGKAIAEKFAAQGFDLAICARSEDDLAALTAQLQKPGIDIMTQKCDVSKKTELKAFADAVTARFGPVDILVNNAGVFTPGQLHSEKEGQMEHLMDTNFYSAYHLSRRLTPGMIERKSGHIFNVCSVASLNAYKDGGSYSVSKFALLGLSKALRAELRDFNIRVTSLIPGATLTDSWKGTTLSPKRFMQTNDLAELVWSIYNLSESTVVEDVVLRPMLGDI
jgi:short-subunit dehydrogenase